MRILLQRFNGRKNVYLGSAQAGRSSVEPNSKGLDPDDWKPFDIVGPGTKKIRINLDDGWFRVMYVAKFEEAVYVLHCFKKKTPVTSKKDKDLSSARYKELIKERSKK